MNKIRVALADDHDIVREGIKLMINNFGSFEIVCDAIDGRDLIDKINRLEKHPDIVLTDISMPVMNGFETIRYLSKKAPSIRCIALSVSNDFNTVFTHISTIIYIMSRSK